MINELLIALMDAYIICIHKNYCGYCSNCRLLKLRDRWNEFIKFKNTGKASKEFMEWLDSNEGKETRELLEADLRNDKFMQSLFKTF